MKPFVAANWKMNTTLSEALILANGVKNGAESLSACEIVLCPPFPWLVPVAEALKSHPLKHVSLGAQNVFYKESGAYTGEVAAPMLKGVVEYVIIGHSERRRVFKEEAAEISLKLKAALAAGLTPILCIGEKKKPNAAWLSHPEDMPDAHTRPVLHDLDECLVGLSKEEILRVIVAYEPVWAISSNAGAIPATGHYANQVADKIRGHLAHLVPDGQKIRILYGGSVTPENAAEFAHQSQIDGFLVGGASLKIQSFLKICRDAITG